MTEEDRFVVDTFTWSFSRLESFYQCKYAWYMNYVQCEHKCSNAFAEYGSCCHKILEQYEKGLLDIFDLSDEYERRFVDEVVTDFPRNKYTDLRESYYEKGRKYFEEIDLPLDDVEVLGVEEKVEFELGGKPFVGFIDYRYRDNYGKMHLMDHKSASISFTKMGAISKKDVDKMEKYKIQQYLYTIPFIERGEEVACLEWNFFNNQRIYRIPWNAREYKEAKKWALDTIALIEKEEIWKPHVDWFFCTNLCDFRNQCLFRYEERKDNG